MSTMIHARLLAISALIGVAALTACPPGPPQVIDTPVLTACEADAQCSTGTLCVAGECRLAQCNPAVEAVCGIDNIGADRDPTCCKTFENCNVISLVCERDPAAVGIGCPPGEDTCLPCAENRDCAADLGFQSFCSGGRCFAQQGRTTCTQDFQCPGGERCDRTEFFCVPDGGACRFCGPEFPELCCEDGQVCDSDSGACIAVGERECDDATDCRTGDLCDPLGRCVQCITDANCGPNTECNEGTGLCESTIGRCTVDADCSDPFSCIRGRCEIPECTTDRDCVDTREVCQDFACVLPPATCNETDEPNNSVTTATELATIATGYGGLLCRGDQDFISFPVQPLKRYSVTVTIASGNAPFNGLAITLTDTSGAVESTATLAGVPTVALVGVSGATETGRFMLAVNSGSSTSRDQWSYTVTIREDEASAEADCSATAQAGQEPNDDFASAIALTRDAATSFSRCSTADVDFFKVDVPALHGVEFTVDGFINAEGNINAELFKGPTTGDRVLTGTGNSTGNSEVLAAPEGSTTYYLRVFLSSASGALQNQLYRVTARAVPRPAVCGADIGENDGAVATASVMALTTTNGLVSGTSTGRRCNPQDIDHVRFTVPGNLGGTLRVAFTHSEGDLALDLLDAAGTQLLTSNTSNVANGSEAIDLPQSASEQTFVARIRLGATSGAPIIAQLWTLELGTFDAAQCLQSEPAADNTFATARCVGDFTPLAGAPVCPADRLPAPLTGVLTPCQATPTDVDGGCFLTCGHSDVDVYRVGSLEANRTISTGLAFDAAAGRLQLEISRSSGPNNPIRTERDTDNNGLIEVNFVTAGSTIEYIVTVRPEGTLGHEGQVYALTVNVSPPCVADAFEPNATPGTATRLSLPAGGANLVHSGTICSADVDVLRVVLSEGRVLDLVLSQLPGARLVVGTEPANLQNPAVAITGATVTANGAGAGTLRFTAPSTDVFYFTIDRGSVDAGFGAYTLTIDPQN